ncbi:hypothetical protein [Spiroplasma endosymbiont of Nebria brevicollis]|uniref:hypothetical protein n=1 Tax=Spiroplasma endosymbiont of Nebria brevicollis TaxID=3066284 RepID=UPI00313B15CD
MAAEAQQQQMSQEKLKELTEPKKEKSKKHSPSNSKQSNWIIKFFLKIWYLCCGEALFSIVKYLFSSRKKTIAEKPVSFNITTEQQNPANTTSPESNVETTDLTQVSNEAEQQHNSEIPLPPIVTPTL